MNSSPYDILIVEDNPTIRGVMQMGFELEGFSVRVACDGLDALNHLEGDSLPQLILIDLLMPKINGFEFLERIKKDPTLPASKIPVIVISAVANASREKIPHAHAVFSKPVDFELLFQAAEKHCHKTLL